LSAGIVRQHDPQNMLSKGTTLLNAKRMLIASGSGVCSVRVNAKRRTWMHVPMLEMRPRQVLPEKMPLDTDENADSVQILKTRLFLVIENRLLRDTLSHLFRRQEDVELVGKGGSAETNPEELAKSNCDVVLLDFFDPEWMSVVSEKNRKAGRESKKVVIGMDAERAPFLEAVRCGVAGYLLKDASAADVAAAVRAVARGEARCPPQMCTLLFQTVAQLERDRQASKPTGKMRFTLRQQKLMKLVANGLTNKEIANELNLSEYTVKNHMSRILKQLDAKNRREAVGTARERGYEMSGERPPTR
jgi:DNA-binding NarL/FixJ family response regulator